MKLVLVEWLDSFGCSSNWQELGTCEPKPMVCRSVGWLAHDGKDCKVVVPHITDKENQHALQQGCGDMTIPSKAILKITQIKTPKRATFSWETTSASGRASSGSR